MPDEIPAAELEVILPHLPAELANRWYKLDENIVCPRFGGTGSDKGVYVLRSRAGAGNWADEVEGKLGDAFRRAARAIGLPEAVRRKYEASATHQEIYASALNQPDAPEHVVAFIRQWVSRSRSKPSRASLNRPRARRQSADICLHSTPRSGVKVGRRLKLVGMHFASGNIGLSGVLAVLRRG